MISARYLFLPAAAAIVAVITVAGCRQEENASAPGNETEQVAPTLTIEPASANVTAGNSSCTFAVSGNTTWWAAVDEAAAEWSVVSPPTGTSNGTVTFIAIENNATTPRHATVHFTAGTLTRQVAVTQAGGTFVLTTDRNNIQAAHTGGNYMVVVNCSRPWTVAVNSEAVAWCTPLPVPGSGNNPATPVTLTVARNYTPAPRAATVTFTADTYTRQVVVTQENAEPVLSAALEKDYFPNIIATPDAGAYRIALTCNLAWTTSLNSAATAWCTLPSPASATGNATVTVNVQANTATNARRTAAITFSVGTLTLTVNVVQRSKPRVYAAASANRPPYAASDTVWEFGAQAWSAAIHDPYCDQYKEFIEKKDEVKCSHHTDENGTRYYYNWPYVHLYGDDNATGEGDKLCPSPWRMPTKSDLQTLCDYSVPQTLSAAWGFGASPGDPNLEWAYYWSKTRYEYSYDYAYALWYNRSDWMVNDVHVEDGKQVRCVKDL